VSLRWPGVTGWELAFDGKVLYDDRWSGLRLAAGRHQLNGTQAVAYLRPVAVSATARTLTV
jgi:anionic cell wall polymer biosynthesis LytR-Cps2A-Psr (LCP) family protein